MTHGDVQEGENAALLASNPSSCVSPDRACNPGPAGDTISDPLCMHISTLGQTDSHDIFDQCKKGATAKYSSVSADLSVPRRIWNTIAERADV